MELGEMAPEPCATTAVLDAIEQSSEWILDGFPRSERQVRSAGFVPVIYLEVTRAQALRRAEKRARMPLPVEAYRIAQQRRLIAPVKAIAACVIQTGWRTEDEVFRAAIDWLELEKQPRDYP